MNGSFIAFYGCIKNPVYICGHKKSAKKKLNLKMVLKRKTLDEKKLS